MKQAIRFVVAAAVAVSISAVVSTALASTLARDGRDELQRKRFSVLREALAEAGSY